MCAEHRFLFARDRRPDRPVRQLNRRPSRPYSRRFGGPTARGFSPTRSVLRHPHHRGGRGGKTPRIALGATGDLQLGASYKQTTRTRVVGSSATQPAKSQAFSGDVRFEFEGAPHRSVPSGRIPSRRRENGAAAIGISINVARYGNTASTSRLVTGPTIRRVTAEVATPEIEACPTELAGYIAGRGVQNLSTSCRTNTHSKLSANGNQTIRVSVTASGMNGRAIYAAGRAAAPLGESVSTGLLW